MKFPIVSVLVLAMAEIVVLENTNDSEFAIVSTTPHAPQNQPADERLTKLEKEVAENNHRLEILELQNKQLQQTLTSFSDLHAEIIANRQKLEAMEFHNKQIDLALQNISSILATRLQSAKSSETIPRDCKELKKRGENTWGIYRIKPAHSPNAFFVLCDMDTRGGGWTYLLNRFDGSQDFYLNWVDYKNGFGNLSGEFWLGLEHLHQLAGDQDNELLIVLVDEDEKEVDAHYSAFRIGNEAEGYKLKTLGGYVGNAGDSLSYHVGMKFSTKDKDQDFDITSCAQVNKGAWWYKSCHFCQLTGRYLRGKLSLGNYGEGIHWETFHGYGYGLKQARMMIRPKD